MAQYLDQDADGKPDHPSVTASMVLHNAASFVFGSEDEWNLFSKGFLCTRIFCKHNEKPCFFLGDHVNQYSPDGFKAYHVTKNDHDWWNCSIVGNTTWVYAELFATEEYGGNFPKGFTPHTQPDHHVDKRAPFGYLDGW